MDQDFFAFFLPGPITTKRVAVRAIVAGAIAGSLLTLTFGVAAIVVLLRSGGRSQHTADILATTLVLHVLTVGTWKRVISAPIVGIFLNVECSTN